MKKFLYLLVFVLVASSCNKDEVITTEVEQFYRAKKSTSVAQWTTVFEYTPAPGQFINETKTGGFTGDETTVQSAVNYAHKRMSDNLFVSLGGFGGYIVTGFDHSIDNVPGYDFASNKGYGSATHIQALKEIGATPIHRQSFIKNFI